MGLGRHPAFLNRLLETEMKHSVLVVIAMVTAGQAFAGGMSEPVAEAPIAVAVEPMPTFSWDGFYAGVSANSGSIDDSANDFDTSGFGLQIGYLRDLGTFVVGGELAYSDADVDDTADGSVTSTRAKLIGGYDAGRFLPYLFVGLSDLEISNATSSVSDTVTNYGLGGRYAFGAEGKFVAGLEYIVEDKDDFKDSGFDLEHDELSLRLDYRF
jgi:outer membrane immunogenic protein